MQTRNDLVVFARLAVRGARHHWPTYSHQFAPKKFTQPSLVGCLCVKEYLRLDYRGVEALLASAAELRQALELSATPDHSTLWWFARHKVRPAQLQRLLRTTLRLFPQRRRQRHTVAIDATGFSRRYASRYYTRRLGGYWRHTFLNWSTLVWTQPQVVCAQAVRVGPGSGYRHLRPLVEQTRPLLRIDRLLADADYDSEAHHQWLRETCDIESIIPAIRGRPGRPTRQPYRHRMQRWFPRRAYGQRWTVETIYSVVKRRFGEALTARRYWLQVKQVFLRSVTYNLYRALQHWRRWWQTITHHVLVACG